MQAIIIVALPLIATPKGLIPKRVTERTSIYLKTPRLIKRCHSLPNSVLRMRKGQCKHFECGFTPVSNPKMIKRGNKIGIYLCKRTKVKITDMAYLRLLRVRTDQCKYRKLAFTLGFPSTE